MNPLTIMITLKCGQILDQQLTKYQGSIPISSIMTIAKEKIAAYGTYAHNVSSVRAHETIGGKLIYFNVNMRDE